MILIPPYMLGTHILSFLPYEDKSYAHSFANEGIPTYVRVVKDIDENEIVQNMTPDDDCDQTRELCAVLMKKHGQEGHAERDLPGRLHLPHEHAFGYANGRQRYHHHERGPHRWHLQRRHQRHAHHAPRLHYHHAANGAKVANGYMLSLGMRFVAIDRETPLIKVSGPGLAAKGDRAQSRKDRGGPVPLAAEGTRAPAAGESPR